MAIPPPPITPVPTPAPQRGDRATFSDRVDAFVTWLEAATAEFEAVAQNTYDNATIAEGSGDVASVGLGITSAAPYMPDIDNAGIAAGFWYVDAATVGTFPSVGAAPGLMIHKVYGTAGFQMYQPSTLDRIFYRRRVAGVWQTWNEFAKSGINTDITQLNALQHIGMVDASPTIDFDESDQTGAAGLWRMVFQGNAWNFIKNTAVAGDFSTSVSVLSATSAGLGQVNGAVPVQQGTGTGQGSNTVKIGWGSSGGGLKATVDTTDQGYFPFSTTNPNGGAVITFANPLTAQAANFTTVTASGLLSANAGVSATTVTASGLVAANLGLSVTGAASVINGGALGTLANNGYVQIGGSAGLNITHDYTNIQARNNGAAATLNLNNLGGLVQVGAGGFASASTITSTTTMTSNGRIFARNTSPDKISLQNGATAQGHIGADAASCFKIANAAFSQYVLDLDNSGNLVAVGNITANSDERLKKDWQDLPEDFLYRLARVKHGTFTRTDTGERQAGASAQDFQAMLAELVGVNPNTGMLSLGYGAAAVLSAIQLAQKVEVLEQRILDLEKAANK